MPPLWNNTYELFQRYINTLQVGMSISKRIKLYILNLCALPSRRLSSVPRSMCAYEVYGDNIKGGGGV